jgi:CheY-like chemotaxis protein
MIVEDDAELRGIVTTLLTSEGYQVEQVADGRTAVERVFLLKPDLILVDLRLPGLDGTEVCKRIRAGRLDTPIIVISAAKEEFDKVLLLELGGSPSAPGNCRPASKRYCAAAPDYTPTWPIEPVASRSRKGSTIPRR